MESHTERTAAVGRLLDHYLHAAHIADHLIDPHGDPLSLPAAEPGAALSTFADEPQAARWFTEERCVLLALVAHAAGWNRHAYQLDRVVARSLFRSGHWFDQVATARAAISAATHGGDLSAQSRAHHNIARAYLQLGEHDLAEEHLLTAIRLADQTEDFIAQGNAYHVMGWVLERQHSLPEAFTHAFEALRRYEAAGHLIGKARTLNTIGWFNTVLGNHDEAVKFCRAALTGYRRGGNREGMAATWHSLGHAQHGLGRYRQALRSLHRCLDLSTALQDCWYEAIAQEGIGDTHHALDDMAAARIAWLRALSLFTDLNHPRTDEVRAKLALS